MEWRGCWARERCEPRLHLSPSGCRCQPGLVRPNLGRAANHPSGDPTPTHEDEAMTLELRHLGSELEVPLKAHVIVTPSGRYAAVHE
ncbi:JAB domain-containing protein [Sorangium sp. So ce1024]|uniref:JAB domain-containing protein n=1 Tax=Sorangium sp. So ce1024 TaxID=3133327 RepID=UPI003F51C78E